MPFERKEYVRRVWVTDPIYAAAEHAMRNYPVGAECIDDLAWLLATVAEGFETRLLSNGVRRRAGELDHTGGGRILGGEVREGD